MIIVNQDKNLIVNLDNIESIYIKDLEIRYEGTYGTGYLLGQYSNAKRVSIVWKELIDVIAIGQTIYIFPLK